MASLTGTLWLLYQFSSFIIPFVVVAALVVRYVLSAAPLPTPVNRIVFFPMGGKFGGLLIISVVPYVDWNF
jgi:hypothetical protein